MIGVLLPCGTSVTVVPVSVDAFMASEKVAVVFAVTATPVAPFAGLTTVTVGTVTSGQLTCASAQSAWS